MTITAFTGDDIRDFGFTNAQDLAKQTPALSFNLNANDDVSMTFSLRGVGLDDFSAFNEAPVAIYFDGVYQATLAGNNSQLFDLERVEILKGPQGTLYGRNTTGGIVHFISRKPTKELEGYVDVSLGEYALRRFEGAVSGPLTDCDPGASLRRLHRERRLFRGALPGRRGRRNRRRVRGARPASLRAERPEQRAAERLLHRRGFQSRRRTSTAR